MSYTSPPSKTATALDIIPEVDLNLIPEACLLENSYRLDEIMERNRELEEQNRRLATENNVLTYENNVLRSLATIDPLTGLNNRRGFNEKSENLLLQLRRRLLDARTEAGIGYFAMIFDLDGFKAVNDSYGHDAGDEVLKVLSSRVSNSKRPLDIVSRLGGDEFGLVAGGVELNAVDVIDPNKPALSEYDKKLDLKSRLSNLPILIAQRLLSEIAKPINYEGSKLHVGASIGIVVCKPDVELAEAMTVADKMLYISKKHKNPEYSGSITITGYEVHATEIPKTLSKKIEIETSPHD